MNRVSGDLTNKLAVVKNKAKAKKNRFKAETRKTALNDLIVPYLFHFILISLLHASLVMRSSLFVKKFSIMLHNFF